MKNKDENKVEEMSNKSAETIYFFVKILFLISIITAIYAAIKNGGMEW